MHTDTALVLRAIENASPKPWTDQTSRWAVVCTLFDIEEEEAISICKRYDLDPEEKLSTYDDRV